MGDFVASILEMVSQILIFTRDFEEAGIIKIIMGWFAALPF